MEKRKVILYENVIDILRKTRITAKAVAGGVEVLFISSISDRPQSILYILDRVNTEELVRRLGIRRVELLEWMKSRFTGSKADEEFERYCLQTGLEVTKKNDIYFTKIRRE